LNSPFGGAFSNGGFVQGGRHSRRHSTNSRHSVVGA